MHVCILLFCAVAVTNESVGRDWGGAYALELSFSYLAATCLILIPGFEMVALPCGSAAEAQIMLFAEAAAAVLDALPRKDAFRCPLYLVISTRKCFLQFALDVGGQVLLTTKITRRGRVTPFLNILGPSPCV